MKNSQKTLFDRHNFRKFEKEVYYYNNIIIILIIIINIQ